METANIIAMMYTQPSMKRLFSSFDIPEDVINKHYSTRKTFSQSLMFELFDSGLEYHKKILHDIIEDISFDENVDRFNYYQEKKEEYQKSLEKLRRLLVEDGYYEENGQLIHKPVLIDDIDKKYEFIILNLRDYNLERLSNTFKDAVKNYSTDTRSSLNDLRTVFENLVKHMLTVNGLSIGNNKQNMEKLRDLGILKIPNPGYMHTENDFSYSIYQMLSNWGTHHSRTPLMEYDYVFSSTILYLDFLIKRINQSGVKTS